MTREAVCMSRTECLCVCTSRIVLSLRVCPMSLRRLYAAMSAHRRCEPLQLDACGALWNLAAGTANQTAIVESGGLPHLYAALEAHPRCADIGTWNVLSPFVGLCAKVLLCVCVCGVCRWVLSIVWRLRACCVYLCFLTWLLAFVRMCVPFVGCSFPLALCVSCVWLVCALFSSLDVCVCVPCALLWALRACVHGRVRAANAVCGALTHLALAEANKKNVETSGAPRYLCGPLDMVTNPNVLSNALVRRLCVSVSVCAGVGYWLCWCVCVYTALRPRDVICIRDSTELRVCVDEEPIIAALDASRVCACVYLNVLVSVCVCARTCV